MPTSQIFNLDATNMKMQIRKYKSSSWKILTSSNSSEDNCGAASSLIFGAFAGAVGVDAGDACDDEANAGHDDDEEGDEDDDVNALGRRRKTWTAGGFFCSISSPFPPPFAPPHHSPLPHISIHSS